MSITYERDDARGRITVTLAGAVSVEDLLAIVDRQAAGQTWHYSLCYDARRITKDAASTVDEVRRVLRHVVETSVIHGARGPVATSPIIPRTSRSCGCTRLSAPSRG